MMILILLVVLVAGFVSGRLGLFAFLAPIESETVIYVLYAMVFAISIGIGAQYRDGEGERLSFKALLYSVTTIAGSLLAACLMSIVLPVSAKDALICASGMGWYSLSTGLVLRLLRKPGSAVHLHHAYAHKKIPPSGSRCRRRNRYHSIQCCLRRCYRRQHDRALRSSRGNGHFHARARSHQFLYGDLNFPHKHPQPVQDRIDCFPAGIAQQAFPAALQRAGAQRAGTGEKVCTETVLRAQTLQQDVQ